LKELNPPLPIRFGKVGRRLDACAAQTSRRLDLRFVVQSCLVLCWQRSSQLCQLDFSSTVRCLRNQDENYFTLNTESTYDWHNDQWTVPINFSVSQLTKIGKLPVQFGLGFKVYAEGPSGASEWDIRFSVTPLFPTGGKPAANQTTYSK
jgi:hypothetical protein